MFAWILTLMVELEPLVVDTYWETAIAIGQVAEARPLFKGQDGAVKTAALLVSLAFYESHFRPEALGDHGHSFGLYQINIESWHPPKDIPGQTSRADDLIDASFRTCHDKPVPQRLSWYAAGGAGCESEAGARKSRARVELAMRLVREHPFVRDVPDS